MYFRRCSFLYFYLCRNKAWQKEVEERRKKRKNFSGPIIGVSCFLGLFVCCGCLGCFFKCKQDHCSGSNGESNVRQNEAAFQQPWQQTNASSTQRGAESTRNTGSPMMTAREGASPPSHVTAPLLPEKPPISPLSNENGSELPPSYATAMAESS